MDSSIVCGVDGSPESEAGVAVAASFARRLDARLVLAHVVEHAHSGYVPVGVRPGGLPPTDVAATLEQEVQAAEQLLAKLVENAGVEGAERRVVTGFAAERLADLADEERAELIVVGSRGRGAFKAAFLGSVSTSLIGVARCPVLVVPPAASEA